MIYQPLTKASQTFVSLLGFLSWLKVKFSFEKMVLHLWLRRISIKVIINKSRGEVFLMEQDTIENVSKILSVFFLILYIFDTSKCATNCIISFEIYIWWFHRSKDFEAMKAKLAIWPKSRPNRNSCSIKISHCRTSLKWLWFLCIIRTLKLQAYFKIITYKSAIGHKNFRGIFSHQKTKPRILQFTNLKCCKMSFNSFKIKKQGLKCF